MLFGGKRTQLPEAKDFPEVPYERLEVLLFQLLKEGGWESKATVARVHATIMQLEIVDPDGPKRKCPRNAFLSVAVVGWVL